MIGKTALPLNPQRKKRTEFGKRCRAGQLYRLHAVCMKTLNIQNIIVPIDFSKMSVQATQIAGQLAQRFGASIAWPGSRRVPFYSSVRVNANLAERKKDRSFFALSVRSKQHP